MRYRILYILSVSIVFACGDKEPTGPESNCELMSPYKLEFNSAHSADIFDVSVSPPQEIQDVSLVNAIFYQKILYLVSSDQPFPYNEYYLDSVWLHDDLTATIDYKNRGPKMFSLIQNDCQLELSGGGQTFKAELTSGGEEIFINQYAIFDHQRTAESRDTFIFIEFRPEDFKSHAAIIAEFAAQHPVEFDTIAIELLENRTKE